ncbi:hypothetical protein GCM10010521_74540 [Streptomyces rameus]|uniref:Tetratricopeptide repeat protein n=1 Tax=Streptomyces rameus TaxID=68261 RepID=A0ABN3VBT2_9ACTN
MRRAVADAQPVTGERDVVRVLAHSGLDTHLVEGDRATEGVAHVREAVGIARDLADADAAHGRVLTLALIGVGLLLALSSSARTESIDVSAEALAVSEQVAAADAAVGEPVLVDALAHHGLRLSEAGRHAEAVSATARAVSLSRGLAAHRRARTRLVANSRREEARDAIAESAVLWRSITDTEPGSPRRTSM